MTAEGGGRALWGADARVAFVECFVEWESEDAAIRNRWGDRDAEKQARTRGSQGRDESEKQVAAAGRKQETTMQDLEDAARDGSRRATATTKRKRAPAKKKPRPPLGPPKARGHHVHHAHHVHPHPRPAAVGLGGRAQAQAQAQAPSQGPRAAGPCISSQSYRASHPCRRSSRTQCHPPRPGTPPLLMRAGTRACCCSLPACLCLRRRRHGAWYLARELSWLLVRATLAWPPPTATRRQRGLGSPVPAGVVRGRRVTLHADCAAQSAQACRHISCLRHVPASVAQPPDQRPPSSRMS